MGRCGSADGRVTSKAGGCDSVRRMAGDTDDAGIADAAGDAQGFFEYALRRR